MHLHYVWENYLDVFASDILPAHVAIGEQGSRASVLSRRVGLGVSANVITIVAGCMIIMMYIQIRTGEG